MGTEENGPFHHPICIFTGAVSMEHHALDTRVTPRDPDAVRNDQQPEDLRVRFRRDVEHPRIHPVSKDVFH